MKKNQNKEAEKVFIIMLTSSFCVLIICLVWVFFDIERNQFEKQENDSVYFNNSSVSSKEKLLFDSINIIENLENENSSLNNQSVSVIDVVEDDNKKDISSMNVLGEQVQQLNSIKEKQQINSDTVGWLKISGTKIDVPIVKGYDNTYYLTHGFDKNESVAGWYYADFRCDFTEETATQNNIIYAHAMINSGMFSQLYKYKKESFYRNNKIIEFIVNENMPSKYIIFASFITDTSFYYQEPNPSIQEFKNIIKTAKNKSLYNTGIEVKEDDVILTLSTCTYEDPKKDLRFVIMAKGLNENE